MLTRRYLSGIIKQGSENLDINDSKWYVMTCVNEFIAYLEANEGDGFANEVMRRIKELDRFTEEEIDEVADRERILSGLFMFASEQETDMPF